MIEQVLLLTNDAVITSLSLLSKVDVLVEQLLSGERDGIDSLQAIVSDLSEPVGTGVFHHLETLNELGAWDMRASAQVNEVAASVCSDTLSISNLTSDGRDLEWVCAEEGQCFFLGQDKTFKSLLLAGNFLGALLNSGVVFLGEMLNDKSKHDLTLRSKRTAKIGML